MSGVPAVRVLAPSSAKGDHAQARTAPVWPIFSSIFFFEGPVPRSPLTLDTIAHTRAGLHDARHECRERRRRVERLLPRVSGAGTTEFDIVREREAFAYGHRQTIFIMVGDDSLLRVAMARRLQRFLNWRGADVMRFPVIDDELDLMTVFGSTLVVLCNGWIAVAWLVSSTGET